MPPPGPRAILLRETRRSMNPLQNMRDWFRELGWISRIAILAGILILIVTGISVFHVPRYEIVYNVQARTILPGTGWAEATFASYVVELGNTGRRVQPRVGVRIQAGVLTNAITRPLVRNFGKRNRPYAVLPADGGGCLTLDIGAVEPDQRVRVEVLTRTSPGRQPPTADEAVPGIDALGQVRKGDPGSTEFARILFSILTSWLPF